jgi:glucose/arabinose dehydrogenase
MPSFPNLGRQEVKSIVAFINMQKAPVVLSSRGMGTVTTNPIPEAIRPSGLIGGLQLVTTIPPSADSGKMPLTRISKLDVQPGGNQLFVLDLRGKLYKLQSNQPQLYMDIAKLRPNFIGVPGLATGFGSFAFHPGFQKNGLLYTTHTEPAGAGKADFAYADTIKVALQWVLMEWKVDNVHAESFSGNGRELMRVNMQSPIHGVQEVTFNPLATPGQEDYGLLYIGVGEGGAVEHGYPALAHSLEKVWGTVLRIDPAGRNSNNKQYGIPVSNPFVSNKNHGILKEIYAWGFRNPHRISWTKTGKMLVANVGHGNIESVNLVLPGHDYGWPLREGTFAVDTYGDLNKVYLLPSNDSVYKVTYPIAQYDHDEGKAISGGFEYTGSALPAPEGKIYIW